MNRLVRLAPVLLAVSVISRFVWAFATPNGMNLVDLHVYVDGSAALLGGNLYDYTYSVQTPDFPLPFTYPPFAALVFFPLHYLPFTLVGVLWQAATMIALFAVVRLTLSMVLGGERAAEPRWVRIALLWTALGLWSEPVRTTLDYGQVNVFLVLLAILAVRSSRWWVAGGLVGFAAGIKLTPAITGLYFLATRRWKAAAFSAVAFALTVAVSYAALGHQAATYFTTLLGDADRIGPVGSVWNQSLRGALSRIVGEDVGQGPLWIVAAVVATGLTIAAWRAIGREDHLGTLVIVQLFGLLISPISWSHHWIWVIPMVIWLVHGPLRGVAGAKFVAGYWLVTVTVGVPWLLSFFQESIWTIPRPALEAWAGAVDVVGAALFLSWVVYAGRVTKARPVSRSDAPDPHPSA